MQAAATENEDAGRNDDAGSNQRPPQVPDDRRQEVMAEGANNAEAVAVNGGANDGENNRENQNDDSDSSESEEEEEEENGANPAGPAAFQLPLGPYDLHRMQLTAHGRAAPVGSQH
ncbi:expressed unknown protein [Seminavis robusta]|uniref:Uncharacterized protein n=1 Tax=Seminavis robusta TaxID=568900 RepID=A0A9N8E3X8_9STRA|nr:expressed unknown protein [Seminavis robusta]|eukprot:Sro636_g179220.1 n/a (116) ;mRNA; r:12386-12733